MAIIREVLPMTGLYSPSAKEHFLFTRRQSPMPQPLDIHAVAAEAARCVDEWGAGAALIRAGRKGCAFTSAQEACRSPAPRRATLPNG